MFIGRERELASLNRLWSINTKDKEDRQGISCKRTFG